MNNHLWAKSIKDHYIPEMKRRAEEKFILNGKINPSMFLYTLDDMILQIDFPDLQEGQTREYQLAQAQYAAVLVASTGVIFYSDIRIPKPDSDETNSAIAILFSSDKGVALYAVKYILHPEVKGFIWQDDTEDIRVNIKDFQIFLDFSANQVFIQNPQMSRFDYFAYLEANGFTVTAHAPHTIKSISLIGG